MSSEGCVITLIPVGVYIIKELCYHTDTCGCVYHQSVVLLHRYLWVCLPSEGCVITQISEGVNILREFCYHTNICGCVYKSDNCVIIQMSVGVYIVRGLCYHTDTCGFVYRLIVLSHRYLWVCLPCKDHGIIVDGFTMTVI